MSRCFAFDRDLFQAQDGTPMHFEVSRCENREELEEYIQFGGGLLKRRGPFTVVIEDAQEDSSVTHDSFTSEYILQCCSQNRILPLKHFRCNSVSMFANFDPNDVLQKKMSWSDAELQDKKEQEREKDSDSIQSISENENEERDSLLKSKKSKKEQEREEDSDSIQSISENENEERDSLLKSKKRSEFTRKEQQKMVDFILETKSYTEVKGVAMWKRMQQKLPNHTWQSLKENFLKKVLPDIKTFRLSSVQKDVFKKVMQFQDEKKSSAKGSRGSYSPREDKLILRYLKTNADAHTPLGGNKFWMEMQNKSIVPGRSWHSVRERYNKVLKLQKEKRKRRTTKDSESDVEESVSTSGSPSTSAHMSSTNKRSSKSTLKETNVSSSPKHVSERPSTSAHLSPTNKRSSESTFKETNVTSSPKHVSSNSGAHCASPFEENRRNMEDEVQIPPRRKKRALFSAASAIPDFSPISVQERTLTWLEKQYNSRKVTDKRQCYLAAFPTGQSEESSSNTKVLREDDQDPPDCDQEICSEQPTTPSRPHANELDKRLHLGSANEKNHGLQRKSVSPGCSKPNQIERSPSYDQICLPTGAGMQNEMDVQSPLTDTTDAIKGKEGYEASNCVFSNFPPEKVVFISDCESESASETAVEDADENEVEDADENEVEDADENEVEDADENEVEDADENEVEDADENEDHIHEDYDSDWSDTGLFWRGGIVFPYQSKRLKVDLVAHLSPLCSAELEKTRNSNADLIETRSKKQFQVKNGNSVEAIKGICQETMKDPESTSINNVSVIQTSKNGFHFQRGINNSYDNDKSQISINSYTESNQCNYQSNLSGPIVPASQNFCSQMNKSCLHQTMSEVSCGSDISENGSLHTIGVKVTPVRKEDVAVQTDPVIILPIYWKSSNMWLKKQFHPGPGPSSSSVGCPSPVPGSCSDSDE